MLYGLWPDLPTVCPAVSGFVLDLLRDRASPWRSSWSGNSIFAYQQPLVSFLEELGMSFGEDGV